MLLWSFPFLIFHNFSMSNKTEKSHRITGTENVHGNRTNSIESLLALLRQSSPYSVMRTGKPLLFRMCEWRLAVCKTPSAGECMCENANFPTHKRQTKSFCSINLRVGKVFNHFYIKWMCVVDVAFLFHFAFSPSSGQRS